MTLTPAAFRAVGTLLLASALACGGSAGPEGRTPLSTPLVEAVEARFGTIPEEEALPGSVRASNQVMIRPEISGRVVEVLVRSGEAVEREQALVRLDPVEARERLRQAEADVRLAEAGAAAARARVTEFELRAERTRALAAQQLVSAQELDTLEAELDALRAGADEAAARVELRRATAEERRSALDKTVVVAPVAGRLGERRVEVGMQVDPSTVLFVVGDLDELILEVNLTEAMLGRVEVGQPVRIDTRDEAAGTISATLSRISPFLDEESFTTLGEIDVDNRERRLRPGMFVTVRILIGQSRQATLVPVTAVWEDPLLGEPGVFVIEDAAGLSAPTGASLGASAPTPEEVRSVAFTPVQLLAEGRGVAGVTGIEPGVWVVTVGQHLLGGELRAARSTAGAAGASDSGTDPEIGARVRPVSWERVRELQDLQDEDLLEGFLDKQRTIAAALGTEIPESEDVVERVLQEASSAKGQ